MFTFFETPPTSNYLKHKYSEHIQLSDDSLTATYVGQETETICLKAISPVSPIWESFSYFECTIKGHSPRRQLTVGLAEKTAPSSKQIGRSLRTYGISVQGQMLQYSNSSDLENISFQENDTIGVGLDMYLREVFFTKNGEQLGHKFQNIETCDFHPAISLSGAGDEVTLNFKGPFLFQISTFSNLDQDLTGLLPDLEPQSVASLVHSYLKVNGYNETLQAFQADSMIDIKDQVLAQPPLLKGRSLSAAIVSDKIEPINLDEDLWGVCGSEVEQGSIMWDLCLGKSVETIEPSCLVKVPIQQEGARDRCNSMELAQLYLQTVDSTPALDPEQTGLKTQENQLRGTIRNCILQGQTAEAMQIITENYPTLLSNPAIWILYAQTFIEIIKSGDYVQALTYAQENLAQFKERKISSTCFNEGEVGVIDVVALLCYSDPNNSILSSLLDIRQRDIWATEIIQAIAELEGEIDESVLEAMYKQLLVARQVSYDSRVKPLSLNI